MKTRAKCVEQTSGEGKNSLRVGRDATILLVPLEVPCTPMEAKQKQWLPYVINTKK